MNVYPIRYCYSTAVYVITTGGCCVWVRLQLTYYASSKGDFGTIMLMYFIIEPRSRNLSGQSDPIIIPYMAINRRFIT